MALYTIADLHLAVENGEKSMEVFGDRWMDYTAKIDRHWRALVAENDTVVIPGDVSWALSLDGAIPDLRFVDSLPGKKILLKGNHDLWWNTVKKVTDRLAAEKISSISLLHNSAALAEGKILCGSRGWFLDASQQTEGINADFTKVVNRENLRLGLSLAEAQKLSERFLAEHPETDPPEKIVFFHFPPVWHDFINQDAIERMKAAGVRRCYFGHIHGQYNVPESFEWQGITFRMISADFRRFTPQLIP